MDVDLEKKETKKVITKINKLLSLNGFDILVDDAGPYREDQLLFKSFCEQLVAVNHDLHLWAASCFTHQIPNGWDVKHFQKTVSCPPAILQDKNVLMLANMNGCKDVVKWDPDNIGVAPTEGLPVKYIYHHGHDVQGPPFTCDKCCADVILLLNALGLETNARGTSNNCQTTSMSTVRCTTCDSVDNTILTPRLQPSDVLVLFEQCEDTDFCKNIKFAKTLKKSGYSTKLVNNAEHQFSSKYFYCLRILNAVHCQGLKRNVTVYVEGRGQLNVPLEWIRLRGVTSCTSQLIWVKDAASSHPEA